MHKFWPKNELSELTVYCTHKKQKKYCFFYNCLMQLDMCTIMDNGLMDGGLLLQLREEMRVYQYDSVILLVGNWLLLGFIRW